MRIGIGIGRGALRAAALCGLIASLAAATPASAATWSAQTVPGPSGPPNAALTGVSCVSTTFCMALGTSDSGFDHLGINLRGPIAAFAERWDGSAWSLLPIAAGPSPTLTSLSCTSPTFCVAVGSTQTAGRLSLVGPVNAQKSRAVAEVWNGTAWKSQTTPLTAIRGSALSGVSCVSSRFCIAVGSIGLENVKALRWNGHSWQQLTLPFVKWGSTLTAVSCAATNACTAVGSYDTQKTGTADLRPLAERWTGRHFTVAKPPPERDVLRGKPYSNFTWLTSVSCPSRTSCLATGLAMRTQNIYPQGGFADAWDGRRWTAATAGIARFSPLNGVSCVAVNDCYAAGQFDPKTITTPATQQPLLAHWASRRWTRETLPAVATQTNLVWSEDNLLDPNLFGISCVLQAGCTAVGAQPQGTHSAPLALSDLPLAVPVG
jgi:hypothetical protein